MDLHTLYAHAVDSSRNVHFYTSLYIYKITCEDMESDTEIVFTSCHLVVTLYDLTLVKERWEKLLSEVWHYNSRGRCRTTKELNVLDPVLGFSSNSLRKKPGSFTQNHIYRIYLCMFWHPGKSPYIFPAVSCMLECVCHPMRICHCLITNNNFLSEKEILEFRFSRLGKVMKNKQPQEVLEKLWNLIVEVSGHIRTQ